MRSRSIYLGAMALAVVVAAAERTALSQGAAKLSPPPTFVFDPTWPKDLPNNWVVGNVVGVAVDSKDNIWMIHRPKSQAGADKTPTVLGFDQTGKLIAQWESKNGPGYEWGTQAHGLYVDPKDSVWFGFGGGLPYDPKSRATTDNANFLKFAPDGKFQLQVGKFGMGTDGSNSTQYLGQPTDVWVDQAANEAYITDGYTNRRVIVVDATTGAYKRHWGAFGKKPDDAPMGQFSRTGAPRQQFDTPHCIIGVENLIYVCDRGNQRIQVFRKDGTFVKDALINAKLDDGSTGGTPWDLALSTDPQHAYFFLVDGGTHKVHTLRRDTLEVVASFGHRGRWAGQFESPHSIAIDSKGALYVAETLDGRRLQRFLPKK
jgi:DNA-binding beta-propeller fold protein YncE